MFCDWLSISMLSLRAMPEHAHVTSSLGHAAPKQWHPLPKVLFGWHHLHLSIHKISVKIQALFHGNHYHYQLSMQKILNTEHAQLAICALWLKCKGLENCCISKCNLQECRMVWWYVHPTTNMQKKAWAPKVTKGHNTSHVQCLLLKTWQKDTFWSKSARRSTSAEHRRCASTSNRKSQTGDYLKKSTCRYKSTAVSSSVLTPTVLLSVLTPTQQRL